MVTVVGTQLNEVGGVVLLESSYKDAKGYEELHHANTRAMAIAEANKQGLPDPRINGMVQVFAVDANGKEIEFGSSAEFAAFRAEISVTRKLL